MWENDGFGRRCKLTGLVKCAKVVSARSRWGTRPTEKLLGTIAEQWKSAVWGLESHSALPPHVMKISDEKYTRDKRASHVVTRVQMWRFLSFWDSLATCVGVCGQINARRTPLHECLVSSQSMACEDYSPTYTLPSVLVAGIYAVSEAPPISLPQLGLFFLPHSPVHRPVRMGVRLEVSLITYFGFVLPIDWLSITPRSVMFCPSVIHLGRATSRQNRNHGCLAVGTEVRYGSFWEKAENLPSPISFLKNNR